MPNKPRTGIDERGGARGVVGPVMCKEAGHGGGAQGNDKVFQKDLKDTTTNPLKGEDPSLLVDGMDLDKSARRRLTLEATADGKVPVQNTAMLALT